MARGEIKFEGNTAVSDRELTEAINQNSGIEAIGDSVKAIYQNLGYFDAGVESDYVDKAQNRVIVIREGKQSKIAVIRIDIAQDSLKSLLYDIRDRYAGNGASRRTFRDFADECIEILADMGYPFAHGEWAAFELNENNDIIAEFKIIPGPLAIISDIKFEGIHRSRPDMLEKASGLKIGAVFSQEDIMRSAKYLENLPYVEISSPYYLQTSPNGDSCTVVYTISELPSTTIEGFGGIVRNREKTDFIGHANVGFGDILGTGRMFSLYWNKKDAQSNELRIKYTEPFILNSRFDLELEAFQVDRDTLFITSGGKVSLIHRVGVNLAGKLYGSISRTVPESGSSVSRSIKRVIGANFSYNNSDFAPNPGSGYELGSELEYRYRSNNLVLEGQNPPTNLTSVGFDGAVYLGHRRRFVAAFMLKGWGIASANGDVPIDEFRFIGGISDLRGYTEQRFPAYRYIILSAEPRIITGKYSRAYIFGDFGFIKNSQERFEDFVFYPGYGLGLVSRTVIGQVRVEIGWGKNDFPGQAVLNFGLEGRF